jgi:hypothetical protein
MMETLMERVYKKFNFKLKFKGSDTSVSKLRDIFRKNPAVREHCKTQQRVYTAKPSRGYILQNPAEGIDCI